MKANKKRIMITVLSIAAIIVLCGCAKDVPIVPDELEVPWVEIESPHYKGTITSMAIGDGGTVYLGAYIQQAGVDPSILLISDDGGDTWRERHIGTFWIRDLSIDSREYLFATGDESSVWRSKDKGETWESFDLDFRDRYLRLFSIVGPNEEIVIWGSDDGIVISKDSGDSWESLVDTFVWNSMYSLAMTSDLRFFAATSDGVFFSEDTCMSWDGPLEGPSEYYKSTWIDVLSDGALVSLAGQVYLSYDRGETWDLITDEAYSIDRIWIDDLDRIYYYYDDYSDARLMMSVDHGQNWTYQMEMINDKNVVQIGAGAAGEIFVNTGRGGPGFCRSLDGGPTWEYLGLAEGDLQVIHWGSDGRLYVCMPRSGIFRTDAVDISWENFNDNRNLLNAASIIDMRSGWLLAGSRLIYTSSPECMEWTSLGDPDLGSAALTLLDIPDTGIFVAARRNGVRFLASGDAIWQDIGLRYYEITSLVMTDSLDLYASCSFGGVFRYSEESSVWDQMNAGLEDLNVEALVLSPDGRLVAGTKYSGLFIMDPAVRIWRKLGDEDLQVVDMVFHDGTLVIGTDYGGFYFYRFGMEKPQQLPIGDGGDITGYGNFPYMTSMSIGPDGHIAFLSRNRVFMSRCSID